MTVPVTASSRSTARPTAEQATDGWKKSSLSTVVISGTAEAHCGTPDTKSADAKGTHHV